MTPPFPRFLVFLCQSTMGNLSSNVAQVARQSRSSSPNLMTPPPVTAQQHCPSSTQSDTTIITRSNLILTCLADISALMTAMMATRAASTRARRRSSIRVRTTGLRSAMPPRRRRTPRTLPARLMRPSTVATRRHPTILRPAPRETRRPRRRQPRRSKLTTVCKRSACL
jgi:hypothetical protein